MCAVLQVIEALGLTSGAQEMGPENVANLARPHRAATVLFMVGAPLSAWLWNGMLGACSGTRQCAQTQQSVHSCGALLISIE